MTLLCQKNSYLRDVSAKICDDQFITVVAVACSSKMQL